MLMIKFLQYINIFAWVYGLIGWTRRKLYQIGIFKSAHFAGVATISIGNLSMGGTGKTPHTEFLIRKLSDRYTLATLSRGYGRQSRGYIAASQLGPDRLSASVLGDEPLQMHKKFPHIEVAVCETRKDGIEALCSGTRPQIILLDDAFQHLQVKPDCHILLTEYAHPYFQDFVVPAGRLREFSSAADNADIIIVTKAPANLTEDEKNEFLQRLGAKKHQEVYFSTFKYKKPVAVTEPAKKSVLTPETNIVAITGIARPEPFVEELRHNYHNVSAFHFQDHHNFTIREIEKIVEVQAKVQGKTVFITTEKDICRLNTNDTKKIISLHSFFTLPIEVEILFGQEKQLIKKIESYVTEN